MVRIVLHRLAGTAEIAAMLGVSRQRVQQLVKRADFPEPYDVLAAGTRIWKRADVEAWARAHGRVVSECRPGGSLRSAYAAPGILSCGEPSPAPPPYQPVTGKNRNGRYTGMNISWAGQCSRVHELGKLDRTALIVAYQGGLGRDCFEVARMDRDQLIAAIRDMEAARLAAA